MDEPCCSKPRPRDIYPALFTDLYELRMVQAYCAEGMSGTAVFEIAFRKLPEHRNYILAAGIADAVQLLANFRFTPDELKWLSKQQEFSPDFVRSLETMRFTGDLYAVREGTPVFANEPMLQVIAPIGEAQLLETSLLNLVHFQSLALTKAARIIHAAKGRTVVDFGSRRAPGSDAALAVARATYLAGGHGSSNVLAGRLFGTPTFGTMAHSYIQAHESEADAFQAFAKLNPDTTLLVDTYDTLEGVQRVIKLRKRLGDRFRVRGVRLDSGDLLALARETRRLLDEAGLHEITIFASSGLDEYEIERLVEAGAPIDGFGVGTKLAVSADAPEIDMAYKLVEYAGTGRFKLSRNKTVYPGRKQVFRWIGSSKMASDTIGRFDENLPGLPLLAPAIIGGVVQPQPSMEESRDYARRQVARLPAELLSLEGAAEPYPVTISEHLLEDLERLRRGRRP